MQRPDAVRKRYGTAKKARAFLVSRVGTTGTAKCSWEPDFILSTSNYQRVVEVGHVDVAAKVMWEAEGCKGALPRPNRSMPCWRPSGGQNLQQIRARAALTVSP